MSSCFRFLTVTVKLMYKPYSQRFKVSNLMVTTGCQRKMCIPKVVGKWLQKTGGSSFVKTGCKNRYMLLQLKLLCDCFGHHSYQQFA